MRDILIRHGINLTGIVKWWLGVFLFTGMMSLVIGAAQQLYYLMMPMSHWLTYHSIEPVKSEFNTEEYLYFNSVFTVNRPIDVVWNDVLHCQIDDRWVYMMDYDSRDFLVQKGYQTEQWHFHKTADMPRFPADCYLDSTIEIHPADGKIYHQKMRSSVFKIRPN